MILTRHQVRQVIAGAKTEHRVPLAGFDYRTVNTPTGPERHVVPRYRLGVPHPVRPETDLVATAVHVVIHSATPLPLAALDLQAARAEGHRTQRDFYDAWLARHGDIDLDELVWAVRFTVEHDPPRFLTPAAHPRGTDLGVTTRPADAMRPDTGETVDPATLKPFWRDLARARLDHAHGRIGERTLEERLAATRMEATRLGIDLSRQEASLEDRVKAMENKVRRRRAA